MSERTAPSQTGSCPRCRKPLRGSSISITDGRRRVRYEHMDGTECLLDLPAEKLGPDARANR